jgi:uncharacterized membrane protein
MQVLRPTIPYQNVHSVERWASVLGGVAIAASGIKKDPLNCTLRMLAGAALVHRGVTGQCEVYRLLGVRTAPATSDAALPFELGVRARAAVTIAQPRHEVYEFMRQFENLPRVMRHLKSVEPLEGGRSRWVAEGPAGKSVTWDAEIINEVPNELLAWKSLPGSDVDQAGSMRFSDAPGDRGTEIRVELQYNPPAGAIGAYVARLFGREPEQEISADLRRLKQFLETGEVVSTEGQSRGGSETGKRVRRTLEEAIA